MFYVSGEEKERLHCIVMIREAKDKREGQLKESAKVDMVRKKAGRRLIDE